MSIIAGLIAFVEAQNILVATTNLNTCESEFGTWDNTNSVCTPETAPAKVARDAQDKATREQDEADVAEAARKDALTKAEKERVEFEEADKKLQWQDKYYESAKEEAKEAKDAEDAAFDKHWAQFQKSIRDDDAEEDYEMAKEDAELAQSAEESAEKDYKKASDAYDAAKKEVEAAESELEQAKEIARRE